MNRDDDLRTFKRKLLIFSPLLISAVCLPMALGLVAPNPVYGFRTPSSLASADVWYQANFAAGVTGVVLGIVAAIINHRITSTESITTGKALLAGAVTAFAAVGSTVVGMLFS